MATQDSKKYIVDYFYELDKDPDKKKKFDADPEGEMRKAGFTDRDIEVLMGGDIDEIRGYLGDDVPPVDRPFWA